MLGEKTRTGLTAVSVPAERVDLARVDVHDGAEQDELPPGWAVTAVPDFGSFGDDAQQFEFGRSEARHASGSSALAEHRATGRDVSAAHASSSLASAQAQQVITIDDDSESAGGSSGDEDADVPLAARIAAQPPRLLPGLGGAPRKRSAAQLPGTNEEEVQLDIVCSGVVAKLVLPPRFKRDQVRVLYAGGVITPSQFESSCGRDVRKKWRSTLRVLAADGSDGISVGKWMAENVEANSNAPSSAQPATPAPPAPLAPPPATKTPAAEAAERLHAQVDALLGDDSVLLAEHAAAFVRLLAGAETLAARVFTTRVLEQTVQLVSAHAPVLEALVSSEALTPLEAFVEAAAAERDAELLLRTLRLLEALPVTLGALQRCGLGKRCNKLQKFAAGAALAPGTPAAAAAADVDKAAARLVAKWKAQVNAETASAAPAAAAAAPPAAKKPRVTSPTAAASAAAAAQKAARALADDDMFTGPAKAKAAAPLTRPTVRVSVVSDAEARALATRAAVTPPAVSPRVTPGAAPSGVAAMPAMERIAKERAARAAAAAAEKAQRAVEYTAAEGKAAVDAQLWFVDLYPEGVLAAPEVLSVPPPNGPLTSNIPSMKASGAAPAAAPRDRKRKRKAVVWAPEATLMQVRVFNKDEPLAGEAAAYPDPATAGVGAAGGDVDMTEMPSRWANVAKHEAAAERRSADAWRLRGPDGQRIPDPMYVAPPLMTAVHGWWCPPPARLPAWGDNSLMPARGEGSSERQTQREREATRPPVVYPTLASVPDHPAQGPARAERPVDNSKAPVINVGEPAAPQPQQLLQQQFMQPPPPPPQQPMMMQQQPQPGYGMPMQQPPQGVPTTTALQQQLFSSMLGMPQQAMPQQQQQPMQMSAPQQQPQQPQQMSWMGPQAVQPQMQQQMQAPAQQGFSLGGWPQQQQGAPPPPQQQQPIVGGMLHEWLTKSAGAPVAQPAPAPLGGNDELALLMRSINAAGGFNAQALQQALLQVGSTPAPAAPVPGPRPPPGAPPPAAHAPAMIGQWPQVAQAPVQSGWDQHAPQQQYNSGGQQQHNGMSFSVPPPQPPSRPPPQSAFTSSHPMPQASFFDRTPLPNSGPPVLQSSSAYKRGPCAFFNTPRGCRNGDACKFAH